VTECNCEPHLTCDQCNFISFVLILIKLNYFNFISSDAPALTINSVLDKIDIMAIFMAWKIKLLKIII